MTRITRQNLDDCVRLLNKRLDRHQAPYQQSGRGLIANLGNLHISGAYGGVALHEIVTEGGGVKDVSGRGHIPKAELYTFLCGMLGGIAYERGES